MKNKLNVGFATVVSGRWPRELPRERKAKYEKWLKENINYNLITLPDILEDKPTLDNAIETFKKSAVDIVIMLYGAFSGDDYATGLAEGVKVPVILWAVEEPELNGGRLLANALVAATMNSASLRRLNLKSHVVLGGTDDCRATSELLGLLSAYNVKKQMAQMTMGLLGYRPTAFYNSAFDEGLIRRTFGVKMEETDLKVIFDKMATYSKDTVREEIAKITIPVSEKLPEGHLENHARLALALREICKSSDYDYSVIKCWPEMGNLHTTPCAVLGRLADEGVYIGCEGDVDANLAYMAENIITGEPSFITDLINIDEKDNAVIIWHCGNAAPSQVSENCKCEIANHPLAGQGTAVRCTLKTGPVTLARFCNIDGEYKLFVAKGESIPTEMYTPGAMAKIRVNTPVRDAVMKIIEEGVPHHYAVCFKDISNELKAFAKLNKIDIIEI